MRDWGRLASIVALALVVGVFARSSSRRDELWLWLQAAATKDVALQGWIGAVLGGVLSLLVAVFVLRRTQEHERERFEQQMALERKHFRKQLRAGRRQLVEQLERERALALEQHRLEAWADFVTELREFLLFPVEPKALDEYAKRSTAAFFRWELYVPTSRSDVVAGVNRLLGGVIGHARKEASEERLRNETSRDDHEQRTTAQSEEASNLIVAAMKYGVLLHGLDDERAAAEKWFRGFE